MNGSLDALMAHPMAAYAFPVAGCRSLPQILGRIDALAWNARRGHPSAGWDPTLEPALRALAVAENGDEIARALGWVE